MAAPLRASARPRTTATRRQSMAPAATPNCTGLAPLHRKAVLAQRLVAAVGSGAGATVAGSGGAGGVPLTCRLTTVLWLPPGLRTDTSRVSPGSAETCAEKLPSPATGAVVSPTRLASATTATRPGSPTGTAPAAPATVTWPTAPAAMLTSDALTGAGTAASSVKVKTSWETLPAASVATSVKLVDPGLRLSGPALQLRSPATATAAPLR